MIFSWQNPAGICSCHVHGMENSQFQNKLPSSANQINGKSPRMKVSSWEVHLFITCELSWIVHCHDFRRVIYLNFSNALSFTQESTGICSPRCLYLSSTGWKLDIQKRFGQFLPRILPSWIFQLWFQFQYVSMIPSQLESTSRNWSWKHPRIPEMLCTDSLLR